MMDNLRSAGTMADRAFATADDIHRVLCDIRDQNAASNVTYQAFRRTVFIDADDVGEGNATLQVPPGVEVELSSYSGAADAQGGYLAFYLDVADPANLIGMGPTSELFYDKFGQYDRVPENRTVVVAVGGQTVETRVVVNLVGRLIIRPANVTVSDWTGEAA